MKEADTGDKIHQNFSSDSGGVSFKCVKHITSILNNVMVSCGSLYCEMRGLRMASLTLVNYLRLFWQTDYLTYWHLSYSYYYVLCWLHTHNLLRKVECDSKERLQSWTFAKKECLWGELGFNCNTIMLRFSLAICSIIWKNLLI